MLHKQPIRDKFQNKIKSHQVRDYEQLNYICLTPLRFIDFKLLQFTWPYEKIPDNGGIVYGQFSCSKYHVAEYFPQKPRWRLI